MTIFNALKPITAILMVLCLGFNAECIAETSLPINNPSTQQITPKDLSKPYTERQTYKEGQQSFYKDNNEWVYNAAFAKTFGMPPENIFPELKGIEAAAFRIEDPGYKLCGMGGKGENCMVQSRCVTDVYIDEAKYPLPWATDQLADWHPYYSSVRWLEKPGELGNTPKAPAGMKVESWTIGWSSLHPFMDIQTHDEVFVGHNGNVPEGYPDWGCGGGPIYGYKRQIIAGLSMISLSYGCMSRNSEKRNVTFRFRSCKKDGYKSLPLKQFHEFVLPNVFERKIDARMQEKDERDKAYYLQILNQLNKK